MVVAIKLHNSWQIIIIVFILILHSVSYLILNVPEASSHHIVCSFKWDNSIAIYSLESFVIADFHLGDVGFPINLDTINVRSVTSGGEHSFPDLVSGVLFCIVGTDIVGAQPFSHRIFCSQLTSGPVTRSNSFTVGLQKTQQFKDPLKRGGRFWSYFRGKNRPIYMA